MRLRTTAAASAVLAVLAAGWSGVPATAQAPSAEAAGGTGCGTARGAGTRAHTVRAAGRTRTYHLTVPPGYTGETRVPCGLRRAPGGVLRSGSVRPGPRSAAARPDEPTRSSSAGRTVLCVEPLAITSGA